MDFFQQLIILILKLCSIPFPFSLFKFKFVSDSPFLIKFLFKVLLPFKAKLVLADSAFGVAAVDFVGSL